MTGNKKHPERLSLSEVNMGTGSTLFERLHWQNAQKLQNNVSQCKIARNLGMSLCSTHIGIKTISSSEENLCMGGTRPESNIIRSSDRAAMKRHDSVVTSLQM